MKRVEPGWAASARESRRVTPLVIKIGGRAFDGPGAARAFARALVDCDRPVVLVHGGGAEVSAWCGRLGLDPRFEDGLRVTDDATLEVAVAVLSGLANRRLVAALRAAGADAVGLAALDGGIAVAAWHADAGRLGRVGTIRAIDPSLLATLLAGGRLPVVASIAACDGDLLNVNADELAAALAGALEAETLLLLSDADGVSLDGGRVPLVAAEEIDALLAHPEVRDGMRPKLLAARRAIAAGVRRVIIARWDEAAALDALVMGQRGTTIGFPETGTVTAGAATPAVRAVDV